MQNKRNRLFKTLTTVVIAAALALMGTVPSFAGETVYEGAGEPPCAPRTPGTGGRGWDPPEPPVRRRRVCRSGPRSAWRSQSAPPPPPGHPPPARTPRPSCRPPRSYFQPPADAGSHLYPAQQDSARHPVSLAWRSYLADRLPSPRVASPHLT